MPGQVEQIAQRLRELRDIAGISMESLAKGIKIPVEKCREYESGAVDIPIGVLYEVAGFFKVDLNELLTGEAPRLHKYCVMRKGKGIHRDVVMAKVCEVFGESERCLVRAPGVALRSQGIFQGQPELGGHDP